MSDLQDSLMQDHLELVERINRRVDSIYTQLCEFEECIDVGSLDDGGDTRCKIMELLETLDDIQEYAQTLRPSSVTLQYRQKSLEEQIKCLEQSVDLLKLETGKNSENHSGSMNE